MHVISEQLKQYFLTVAVDDSLSCSIIKCIYFDQNGVIIRKCAANLIFYAKQSVFTILAINSVDAEYLRRLKGIADRVMHIIH